MNVDFKLPIWSAYIIAPLFLLAVAGKVIWRSESPMFIAGCTIGSGLLCAAVMHAYSALTTKK